MVVCETGIPIRFNRFLHAPMHIHRQFVSVTPDRPGHPLEASSLTNRASPNNRSGALVFFLQPGK